MAWVKVERAEKKVEPFSVDFTYAGTVQEYVVPVTGLYKLEVWGAKGGSSNSGNGGYSIGYRLLTKDTIIYICCGGVPYNGGGGQNYVTYGGGATHIAFVSGTIASIGKTIFDKQGLIVAGGGGGNGYTSERNSSGGSGGGLTGGSGQRQTTDGDDVGTAPGGTQTSGNAFGQGGSGHTGIYRNCGGGGGGYYGGQTTTYFEDGGAVGGGGGSGWIGGVPSITYKGTAYNSSTSNGVNSGKGKAKISYIA